MANDFDLKMEEYGFARVQNPSDMLRFVVGYIGSATFRRGPVRLELTTASLGVHKGSVGLYDSPTGDLVVMSVVTDFEHRGLGQASRAVSDLISVAKDLELRKIWVDPAPIPAHRPLLNLAALTQWYERLGFTAAHHSGIIMAMEVATTGPVVGK